MICIWKFVYRVLSIIFGGSDCDLNVINSCFARWLLKLLEFKFAYIFQWMMKFENWIVKAAVYVFCWIGDPIMRIFTTRLKFFEINRNIFSLRFRIKFFYYTRKIWDFRGEFGKMTISQSEISKMTSFFFFSFYTECSIFVFGKSFCK